jgi:type I restriction enzyme, S subunit
MSRDWAIKTIAECASPEPYSTQIGPFGKALMADQYTESGVPVLRGVNVNRGRFHDGDFVFIDGATADRLSKFESYPGDVLLVHKGTLGQIGLMPNQRKYSRYIMGNSMMRVRCDTTKLLPEYLYYWLSSTEGQHYIFSRVSQVGVPQIQTPLSTLRQAALPVPSLAEQIVITTILGKLDDKIELNRRMNETLESIVRAIFKSWFGGFDTVRGRAELPTGWTDGKFGDVAENVRDQVVPSEAPLATPYIGLDHMPRRSISLSEWGRADGVASNKFAFETGDILFGKLRPYFHKVGVAAIDGVCSTDILVIRPNEPLWFSFVLGHASSSEMVDFADAGSTGTKMPRTSWSELTRFAIAIPPRELAQKFNDAALPLVQRIRANIHESRTLASLRDSLLPKLMSGAIRIKDAEQTVEVRP